MRSHVKMAPSRVAALALAVALAAILVGCSSGSSSSSSSSSSSPSSAALPSAGGSGFEGAALPVGAPAHDFTLFDPAGRRVSLNAYRGQVTILAFLYSTCEATCIVIAQQIRGALDELQRAVPVLMVSAEPRADTPAHIERFLARVSLRGRVRYLSGSLAQLRPVWRSLQIVPATAGRAAFNRSASVLLLDRSGRPRVIYQLGQLTPEALAHDVRKLL
jgi:protein SCO1